MIGTRLKQARLLAGMTQPQLADQIGKHGYRVSKQVISKYENGKSYPTAHFLMLASTVLDVPTTYFTHQPSKRIDWRAFRCRARLSDSEKNRIKAYAGDIVELQVELRELLYPRDESTMPTYEASTVTDAEHAAIELRKVWNVGDRPLDSLVQTAEDRGIIVVGWEDHQGLFDGLSGTCADYPVTVINTHFPSDRQRLTLAHEIGHLAMDVNSNSQEDEEKLAFRFAAAFLVPAKHAVHELGVKRHSLDWRELMILKRKYGLSMAAWITRAKDLGIITEHCHRLHFTELSRLGWRKQEPVEYLGDEKPVLFDQMARRAIAEGLIDPDLITHWDSDSIEPDTEIMSRGEYPSAIDLLAMGKRERDRWVSQMFQWAEDTDFELFEAFGEEEF